MYVIFLLGFRIYPYFFMVFFVSDLTMHCEGFCNIWRLGIAGLSGSVLTSVLSTTLEDLLALALCSAGG
jgi:hypothetical protein